jgi:sigma-B regulation protein RsbU (phosphoserine phosphatase)
MYDPTIVDTFTRAYKRIMPTDEAAHPLAKTLGGARTTKIEPGEIPVVAPVEAATSEVLAVTSLARAVSGEATIADVGALTWMMLRQVVPCVSMALFTHDEKHDAMIAHYADGAHSPTLRGVRVTLGTRITGWSAAHRRFVLNGDPAIDLGPGVVSFTPPLRSSLTVPLIHRGNVVAVISIYASTLEAFTDDHARLLSLLAPSLATSVASVHRAESPVHAEPRRAAVGEFRLLKR